MSISQSVVGVILAGGLGKRMGGGDTCVVPRAGKTVLQRTVERAQPQVGLLLLNANGSSLRFARTSLPVIPDVFPNNLGPLAGIHAGLKRLPDDNPDDEWLSSFASDTRFFTTDLNLILRGAAAASNSLLAVSGSVR